MIKILTSRYEMRLTLGHYNRLVDIAKKEHLPSKADAIRYLIDKEYDEIIRSAKNARK